MIRGRSWIIFRRQWKVNSVDKGNINLQRLNGFSIKNYFEELFSGLNCILYSSKRERRRCVRRHRPQTNGRFLYALSLSLFSLSLSLSLSLWRKERENRPRRDSVFWLPFFLIFLGRRRKRKKETIMEKSEKLCDAMCASARLALTNDCGEGKKHTKNLYREVILVSK